MLFCCVALPIVDARTSTPPEDQAFAARLPTATTSTSATSASRGYRLPSRLDPRCYDLPGSIRHPFGRIAFSWLDPSMSWPSRPDPPFPFYSTAGADTMTGADACAAVGLPGGAP